MHSRDDIGCMNRYKFLFKLFIVKLKLIRMLGVFIIKVNNVINELLSVNKSFQCYNIFLFYFISLRSLNIIAAFYSKLLTRSALKILFYFTKMSFSYLFDNKMILFCFYIYCSSLTKTKSINIIFHIINTKLFLFKLKITYIIIYNKHQ